MSCSVATGASSDAHWRGRILQRAQPWAQVRQQVVRRSRLRASPQVVELALARRLPLPLHSLPLPSLSRAHPARAFTVWPWRRQVIFSLLLEHFVLAASDFLFCFRAFLATDFLTSPLTCSLASLVGRFACLRMVLVEGTRPLYLGTNGMRPATMTISVVASSKLKVQVQGGTPRHFR